MAGGVGSSPRASVWAGNAHAFPKETPIAPSTCDGLSLPLQARLIKENSSTQVGLNYLTIK